MKRFIANFCLFAFVKLFVLAGIILFQSRLVQLKIAAETTYEHILLSNSRSPRLILIGDSNLVMGIRSGIIKRETDYNPVNMGLIVSRGLEFMLSEVRDEIRPGDLVHCTS